MIPFVRAFDFTYGRSDRLSPLVERVIAENPGPFTFTGTGTYIVGRGEPGARIAVIDPGPMDDAHLAALTRAVEGRVVSHILITHTHRDHVPLARPFAEAVGRPPILAATPPDRTTHASIALDEGDDDGFQPDSLVADGELVAGDGWTLEVIRTPGHASNHLAFALMEENALFCGDHVMGWSTTVVAPPDGDMFEYMASLDRVIARDFAILYPTHGAPVTDVAPFLRAYRDHRLDRERQVIAALGAGPRRIADMVPNLYAAVDQKLWPAAALSVWAHLIALYRADLVHADPSPGRDALWRLP